MQNERIWNAMPLLSGMPPNDMRNITFQMNADVRTFSGGEVILAEECFSPALIYVLDGQVTVTVKREGKSALLNTLRQGDLFGAASLFGADGTYPTTVTAKGATKCAIITEQTLTALFEKYPRLAINYIRFLSEKIRFLNERLDTLTGRSVESKLAKYLLQADGKGALHSRCNMSQLASALDVGRASLYRLLHKMEDAGLIAICDGVIEIININEIERISKQ